ncbi:CoA transferase [Alicyclobacillus cycloheptanicus]|uniref:Crotonobetainyl-CoA:carnitine CoA-transferase CaiB-like acyl-CoA transferase n=1 Tax=Alicyclobacillus cycloheptanicus TaxID=1457 RepID=A0ABT9XJM6_9BACL|nr:CoA transferase [Alicyclobacillus cycloheptanicus]MDQ0189916.1 crotonobetainyl-CoA:carnitine CoA-transferase CaiB-like acyl-CoA transferase [Alicyclobacillus cycloheptanicus]WDM02181.1 CoA transferase [Alicyclobacillus cycloheptanicus]
MLPLSGVRVIDFTRVLAGPFCTMNLADLGADVIKVESLDGDETRGWGPPFAGDESAYFLCVNRNKRSIALNLADVEGRAVAARLIEGADVVLQNFLPSSAEKLGVSYEQVRAIRPDIIYASISGHGQGSARPGYDYIMQAIGGLMSITGDPAGPPMKVGVAITDLFTGLYATVAIQAALMHRAHTGEGQAIDMALYDAQIAMLANVASNVLISGKDAPRLGNGHPNIVPYQLFHTRDGAVVITVGNDRQFRHFCDELGIPPLYEDERYATNPMRVKHRDTLCPLIEAHLGAMSTAEVIRRLEKAGVPCGPVRSVQEALCAKETVQRDMVWDVVHRTAGQIQLVGSPLKLSETPPELRLPPPFHGEHTTTLLAELGYDEHQIQFMMEKGVVCNA